MRRPHDPKDKESPDDRQPPGGRAWQRVRDFERARGLPAESTPHGNEEPSRTDKEPTQKKP
jgi:hypothetical protein